MIARFLESMFTYCVILTPFYGVIRYLIIRKKSIKVGQEFLNFIFFLYVVSIFSQTILPSREFWMNRSIERSIQSNFELFKTIGYYIGELNGPLHTIAIYNLLGNIILFIPFGILIPWIYKKLNQPIKMIIVAFLIPVFIEGTQYFIGRSVDVDDVLLNFIAIIIGYIMFINVRSLSNLKNMRRQKVEE